MTDPSPSRLRGPDQPVSWGRIPAPVPADPPSELRSVLLFLRCNWPFILLCGIALMLVAAVASAVLPARYTATASLIVESQRPRPTVEPMVTSEDAGYVETQILIIGSDLILAPVVRTLRLAEDPEFTRIRGTLRALFPTPGWPEGEAGAALRERAATASLQRQLRVRRIGTSFIADIAVTSADAAKAARIANLIASTFIEDQRRLTALVTGRAEARTVTRTIAAAAPPIEPAGPSRLVVLAVSAIIGLLGAAAIAAIRQVLDRRLRSPDEVEAATGLPCPAAFPHLRPAGLGERPPVPSFRPGLGALLPLLESRRPESGPLVIGITALSDGAGRAMIATSLDAFAANLGRRSLIIDATMEAAAGADGTQGGLAAMIAEEAPRRDLILVRLPPVAELGAAPAMTAGLHAIVLVVDWGGVEARIIIGSLRILAEALPVAVVLNKARARMGGLWY